MTVPPLPFWHPARHADRRPALLARGRIKAAVRRWFEQQDFVEVETACLQVSPGNETHLHAFATEERTEAGVRTSLYLHTSPEFAMKKLLAAGEKRIFTFASVFRNGERSALHSPEFTMLEWYRAGEDYTVLMRDCAEILGIAAEVSGTDHFAWRGATASPTAEPERISVDDLFRRHAGIGLLDATLVDGAANQTAMAAEARRIGVRVSDDDTWSDLFSRILVERIEPVIRTNGKAVIVDRYPTHEAALARPAIDDPRVAERFELYACGVELANAFGELTDAAEQRRRFALEMAEKERIYGERYPIDEDFISALGQMPPASGAALGFDRLVMLATGAPSVEHVMWTPVAETGRRAP